jgi:hypothetical protein
MVIKSFPSGTELLPCSPQLGILLTEISRLMDSPLDLNVSFVLWTLYARGDTSTVSLVCIGSGMVLRDWLGRGGKERCVYSGNGSLLLGLQYGKAEWRLVIDDCALLFDAT